MLSAMLPLAWHGFPIKCEKKLSSTSQILNDPASCGKQDSTHRHSNLILSDKHVEAHSTCFPGRHCISALFCQQLGQISDVYILLLASEEPVIPAPMTCVRRVVAGVGLYQLPAWFFASRNGTLVTACGQHHSLYSVLPQRSGHWRWHKIVPTRLYVRRV